DCNIGDKETKILSEALYENTTLSTLCLHENRIGKYGVEELVKY
ncbi:15750_t:CDS:2, partial [Cetraspora pellucida]